MNTATPSGRDATPDVAASGPTPSGAAKPTRPAGLEEGRDSGYFDSSASNASGSPRLSLSAAPAFMQDGTPPRSLDDEYLADRVNPDKPGDTDYTIGSWGHDNDSDKTALFPEYHPAPFPSGVTAMDPPSQGLDIAGDSRKKGHGPPWQEKGKGQEDSNDEQDCRARPTRANGQRRSHAPAAGDRGGANTCRQRSFRVARKQATDGAAATVFLRYARSFGKQLHFGH
ncbi:hypothetical protein ACCO45_013661 [Purpureocillium lilacinum]|uniref:Uncharacterized protein n=1 Tax=Purpureocillium lilacinum TaxID=33203 RepID=A0ACC4D8J1_PURLI